MPQRALLVSDERESSGIIHSALSNEGFVVAKLQDSLEVMRKVHDFIPDVVIMEDRLSAKGSIDLCFQIRCLKYIPLILLGDEEGDANLIEGLQRGADFYMRKPVSVPEVVARVRALLRRRGRGLGGDGLFLNIEEYTVVVGQSKVRLTSTEFRLLVYMILNRGRSIPTEEFLSQVWVRHEVTRDWLKFYVSQLCQN